MILCRRRYVIMGQEMKSVMKKIGVLVRKTEWKERFADILYTLFIVAAASLVCLLLNQAGVMKTTLKN